MKNILQKKYMKAAIDKAMQGIKDGQSPFGACIVKKGKIITCVHNTVWRDNIITNHAEINAIRNACKKLNTVDLSGCVIYSTCEPCPMCFSACHWAKISTIVYGTRIKDAERLGFSELVISNKKIKILGKSHIKIIGDYLREENLKLFKLWSNQKNRKTY